MIAWMGGAVHLTSKTRMRLLMARRVMHTSMRRSEHAELSQKNEQLVVRESCFDLGGTHAKLGMKVWMIDTWITLVEEEKLLRNLQARQNQESYP